MYLYICICTTVCMINLFITHQKTDKKKKKNRTFIKEKKRDTEFE